MDGRPPTSAGNRPGSGIRPPTSSAANLGRIPGTASRLISASNSRAGTLGGLTPAVLSHISVVERPMSQQGLVTPKTGVRTPRRQVQDKTYFMSALRGKVCELTNEISRLTKEADLLLKEQATYLTYEKRAEAQALELKRLQGQLADYNLLADKLNADAEMSDVQQEYKGIKSQNEAEAESVDKLFEQRQEREAQLSQLESEITGELNAAENLTATMALELRQQYHQLKKIDNEMQRSLEKLQQNLDLLATQKISLEEELSMSQVKQEASVLYNKLRDVEEKRDALVAEEQKKGSPQEEQENLVRQVKEHNAEIISIERQTSEVLEQVSNAKVELEQLDQELEDYQGERISKYKELKKREETMDSFLSSFDENQVGVAEKRSQLEVVIISLLEKSSRNLGHVHHIPTPQELALLKDDLQFKEGEMEKSRITVMTLSNEQKKLAMDLTKIEQLETKIQQELETLQKKITSMEKEMAVFSDLEALKSASEQKKQRLMQEEKILGRQRSNSRRVAQDIQNNFEVQKRKINENETFAQLCNLERRWQLLEQNIFALTEFIASKKALTDHAKNKKTIKQILLFLNGINQEILSN